MPPKVQMVLMGSAIACLAIGLAAFVAIRNDYFKQSAQTKPDQGKSAFVSELSAELDGILPKKNATATTPSDAILTAAACAKAGGTWNECGSLCRGKPADTVCTQVCVPQCECTVGEKQCPQGYFCASDLPAGDGVCKVGASGGAIPPIQVVDGREFKSADGVTSVFMPTLKLANPFSFSGTSTAFENALSWKLEQADGKVVANGFMMVDSPDVGIPGDYRVRAYYEKIPTMASGTLIVYEASAKDGSPIHEVRIPVELTTRQVGVYVYWSNSKKTPGMPDCSVVFPVKHQVVALSGDEMRVAMHELMKGPTEWELSQGYSTNLPAGTVEPEPTLSGLEFGEDLQQGVGGSCRVTAIRAQINETYKRNAGVDANPVISIDGRTEDILQP